MKITMLGTGAALLDPDRGHSSIAVTVGKTTYLLDCGSGASRQLVKANIDPTTVKAVFLSHLHFDHIADFPVFVIANWMADRQTAPIVVGPPGTVEFVDHLFEDGAFAIDIKARIQYPQRQKNAIVLRPDVRLMEPGLIYEDDNIRVTAGLVDHIPEEISKCFGLRLEAEGKVIAFSGDTAPCDTMLDLARDADLLIHEATFPEAAIEFRSKAGIGTFSHTSPRQLGVLAKKANVKSVVATHFGHWDSTNAIVRKLAAKHMPVEMMGPHLMDEVAADIREAYDGPIALAHDQMVIHL
ncbi:MAG: MBL fold hydrolase [Blastopirellula sp.]|nr:MAG: MBL fold hydrolase [Blastopirellula sp.]